MSKEKINVHDQLDKALEMVAKVRPYTFVGLLVLIGCLYGFLVLRINTLSNTQPSSDAVSSQLSSIKVPRIDPAVINQLKSLQDNSVNVKTLFDQARSNPFQE